LEVTEGTRSNPDGMTLRWRMAGLAAALGPERLPFFIEWPGGQGSPELDGLRHDPADGVEWVELGGQEHRVREWLGEDVPGVRAVSGPPGVHRCCIRRGGESVVLGPR
jgi:hypothetical protein